MALDRHVFERRRRRFMEQLGGEAAALFPAAPESMRSRDVEYRYRQHSDFYYLTGFDEPGAVCLLLPGHPTEEYVLFVQPRDQERETWTGRRLGTEGAIEHLGASTAYPAGEMDSKILEFLRERRDLYYAVEPDRLFNQRVLRWLVQTQTERPRSGKGACNLLDPREILHEMRLRKEPEDLDQMRRAAAITAEAHREVMRQVRPGRNEYEIEALLDYEFRRAGAAGAAYPSIVASGVNATVLHYTRNDRAMAEGDLLLVDAAAEYEFYCADVTRTLPVGRRFEGRARAVYEVVLAAQIAAIDAVRPGVRVDDVHERAVQLLVRGLLELGLMIGEAEAIREKELYKPFFMHRTSHWLGMDVHDVGLYKAAGQSRVLEPGMVLTVEPGLYIGNHMENVAAEWHGIGVRIEDDVLVTAGGHEVLSTGAPKDIDAVESLRAEAWG
jgi:Xaa-Pro aminopeptidase